MARIFIDGFESKDANAWDAGQDLTALAQSEALGGGYYTKGINTTTKKTFASDVNEIYVSQYIYHDNDSAYGIAKIYNGSTVIGTIRKAGGTKKIEVYSGDSASLRATGSTTIDATTWYHIEFRYHPDTSSGLWQVKVDGGELDIDYSGATSPSASTVNGYGMWMASGGSVFCYFDHLVIDDSDWIGNSRIVGVLPTGDSSISWDATATDNFSCIDELDASVTDYVFTNTADQVDLYTVGNISASIYSIKSVQVQAVIMKKGVPAANNVKIGVKTEGAQYYSDDNAAPAATARGFLKMFEYNPSTTDTLWTVDQVNNMELAIKSSA